MVEADVPPSAAGFVESVGTGASRDGVKLPRERVALVRGVGIPSDAHAGNTHRQLSLVAAPEGPSPPALLAANLRTRGLAFDALADGRRLRVGPSAVVQVTEQTYAASARGVDVLWLFARVVRSGEVAPGDVITTDAAFDGPRFAILTLSDRRAHAMGGMRDESGALAETLLSAALRAEPRVKEVLPDDAELLKKRLVELADDEVCDLIVTTGGTGLAPRDVTPEATLAVIEREVPGVAEAIRAGGLAKTPFAMLSRGVCGQRGSTLIVNLSGSPKAVREQLAILIPVLPHVLTTASGVPQSCAELPGDR